MIMITYALHHEAKEIVSAGRQSDQEEVAVASQAKEDEFLCIYFPFLLINLYMGTELFCYCHMVRQLQFGLGLDF